MHTDIHHFKIESGISDLQRSHLLHHVKNDDSVIRFTRDATRFTDREAIDGWERRASAIFTLTDASQELLGLIWFEKMDIPEDTFIVPFDPKAYKDTFAIRLYSRARGKRLARWFMNHAFRKYHTRRVWLKVSQRNVAAVRAYTGFGFVPVTAPDDAGKISMILPEDRL